MAPTDAPSADATPDRSAVVNSVRIDPITPERLLRFVTGARTGREPRVVHFIPAHPTVLARQQPAYRSILNRGDLNVPDGMSVVWALRLHGLHSERLAGPDAMRLVCDRGREHGLRHYFLGGSPEVVARLSAQLQAEHPGLAVAGAESPPFRPLTEAEWREIAERIRAAGTDVLWVGLGTPKQNFAAERLRGLSAAPAVLAVGAAFDFLAGAKPRAPEWMRRAGFEWLHRLGTEPTRLWARYLIGNPAFVAGVLSDVARSRLPRARRRPR